MKVGAQISAARLAKNLTQEALAQQLGVSMMTVSRWERDASAPPLMRLQEIAEALGVTVTDLLDGVAA